MRRCRKKARLGGGGLTSGERFELLHDLIPVGLTGFSSKEELETAWWKHRGELLGVLGPFRRPTQYWWIEVGCPPPDCAAGGRRRERDVLVELGLELTPEERSILEREKRETKV